MKREELEKALEELDHIDEVIEGLWRSDWRQEDHVSCLRKFIRRELRDKEMEALKKYNAALGLTTP